MTGARLCGGLLAVLASTALVRADDVRPLGPEFQVSAGHHSYYAYLDGYASNVAVSRAPSGDFVVVWEDVAGHYLGGDTSYNYRVSTKRFHRDGSGAGQQITVFQSTKKYVREFKPDVAADVNDGFVVVWGYSYDDGPFFDDRFGRVWAERFDANSSALSTSSRSYKIELTAVGKQTGKQIAVATCIADRNGAVLSMNGKPVATTSLAEAQANAR